MLPVCVLGYTALLRCFGTHINSERGGEKNVPRWLYVLPCFLETTHVPALASVIDTGETGKSTTGADA